MKPTDCKPDKFRPFTVVLTGGIATGKTTVSRLFQDRGVPVIDTDQIGRQIVEPGGPALEQIVASFGSSFLNQTGFLDRNKIKLEIFGNPTSRAQLEQILHPLILDEVRSAISKLTTSYCIVVIPLYSDKTKFVAADRVLFVDISQKSQLERLLQRDGITPDLAQKIIASPMPKLQRLKNAEQKVLLHEKVGRLHQKYLKISKVKWVPEYREL